MLQERESELENTMVAKSRSDEFLHKSVNEQKVWFIDYTKFCVVLILTARVLLCTRRSRYSTELVRSAIAGSS
jgi:hypothetical protein